MKKKNASLATYLCSAENKKDILMKFAIFCRGSGTNKHFSPKDDKIHLNQIKGRNY